jgi:hypothetical protein
MSSPELRGTPCQFQALLNVILPSGAIPEISIVCLAFTLSATKATAISVKIFFINVKFRLLLDNYQYSAAKLILFPETD